MTLNQLRYFCELAKSEHYGNTAKALYISQPALSKAIANLEEELDVQLFVTKGRRVVLTRAGKLFYYQITPILEQLDNACRSMEQFKNKNKFYSIGCISPAITSVFSPILDAYKKEGNISLRFNMTVDSSENLIQGLLKGEHELVFCTKISKIGDIHYLPVARLPYVVVMRSDDPLATKEYILPGDLNGRDMVFSNSTTYASNVQRMLSYYKSTPVINGVANDDSALIGLLRAGMGIFITNDYPQIHSEGLVIKELRQDLEFREIQLAYTNKSLEDTQIQHLISFIQNHQHSFLNL